MQLPDSGKSMFLVYMYMELPVADGTSTIYRHTFLNSITEIDQRIERCESLEVE